MKEKKESVEKDIKEVEHINRGNIMSAIEYAVSFNKSIPVARALIVVDPIYKEDHFKYEWDFIFDACITKPIGISLEDHMKNLKK